MLSIRSGMRGLIWLMVVFLKFGFGRRRYDECDLVLSVVGVDGLYC